MFVPFGSLMATVSGLSPRLKFTLKTPVVSLNDASTPMSCSLLIKVAIVSDFVKLIPRSIPLTITPIWLPPSAMLTPNSVNLALLSATVVF